MSYKSNPLSMAPLVPETHPAEALGPEPLTGQHIRLERLTMDHMPELWENVGAHADLWTWWPEGPFTEAEFATSMSGLITFMAGDLATYAAMPTSGPHKGKVGGLGFALSEERDSSRVGEVGLFLGPLLGGSRAGTELVYILLGRLFDLNHRRVQWKTNALNIQSRSAAERYGFVLEGILRQHQINKGRNRDTALYSMIDTEWPVCKEAFEKWLADENFDEQQQQKQRLQEIRKDLGGSS